MTIERSNSFHLLLSDDELKLLRLLAEREGLNASDYLRMLLRTMPNASAHMLQGMRLGAALGGKVDLGAVFEAYRETSKRTKSATDDGKRKKAK
jgi:hypothetical protein